MDTLEALQAERERRLRLRPEVALATFEEAERFLSERGLVTLTPQCALPSVFGAVHEEPYSPGAAKGFGSWPRTRWWWGFELAAQPQVVPTKLLRGAGLFLSERAAAAVDRLCRAELARAEAGGNGEDARRVVAHLAGAGPSLAEEVAAELGLGSRQLGAARRKLERVGAVVARSLRLEAGGGHRHASELRRWDQERPEASAGGLAAYVEVAVAAAVVAPEDEVARWLPWPLPPTLFDELVAAGRLSRPAPGWIATLPKK